MKKTVIVKDGKIPSNLVWKLENLGCDVKMIFNKNEVKLVVTSK